MSKGYWVTSYRKTNDAQKLAAYAQLAPAAVAAAGGKFIVRGVAEEAREQGLKERTVVIESAVIVGVVILDAGRRRVRRAMRRIRLRRLAGEPAALSP